MCKVFMVAGIKPDKVPLVAKLAKNMARAMAVMEDDGIGYAAITKDGQIYGEKWLNKEDAFIVHSSPPADPILERMNSMFKDSIEIDKKLTVGTVYGSFGDRNSETIKNTVAMILHARKATQGSKTIRNVHPFVKFIETEGSPQATALIHNGSILNHEKLTKEMSDCDSEVILHEYLANQMYHNPWGVDQLAKTLVGQYTVGVLSSSLEKTEWKPYLDIFKSNKDLMGAYVPELETFVFSTTEYTLEAALKDTGMTMNNKFKVKDGFLHRIDAITGMSVVEPITFNTSSQYYNVAFNTNHVHSAAGNSSQLPYGPAKQDDDTTVGSAKKHFERRHSSLFTSLYLEADCTPEERAFFAEMDKDQKNDRKALRLVSAALGIQA